MPKIPEQHILAQYDKEHGLRNTFTSRVDELCRQLLARYKIHSITSRTKDRHSVEDKLRRSESSYASLADVTDISGIRVVTYFSDDVEKIGRLVEKEFVIDVANSVDKGALLDPDRFGYVSLHYVVTLSAARLRLAEYRKFSACKAEIQIRSILQHAWAEIEHDLGYKSTGAVPREIRRRFSRLAGLLEVADGEFMNIRRSLDEYQKDVSKQLPRAAGDVLLDLTSLNIFMKTSRIVARMEKRIARAMATRLEEHEQGSITVEKLKHLGLNTIADVKAALEKFEDTILRWVQSEYESDWNQLKDPVSGQGTGMKRLQYISLSSGISLFHLCYFLAADKGGEAGVIEYMKWSLNDKTRGHSVEQAMFARRIVETLAGCGH